MLFNLICGEPVVVEQGRVTKENLIKLFAVAIVVAGMLGASVYYNSVKTKLKTMQSEVQIAWKELEGSYQRQADFIPFMAQHMSTLIVKGKPVLEESLKVFNEKGKRVYLDNQENLPRFEKAQVELGVAVNNLLAIQESEAKLKNIKPLVEARILLNDVRRKITEDRKEYFAKNQRYNEAIQKFPVNLVAPGIGALPRPYFSEDAPKVTDHLVK